MPALPAAPGVIKLQFFHLYGGNPAWVHKYMHYTGTAPAQADITAIANSAKSAWVTNLAPLCTTQVVLQYVLATDLSSASASQGQSTGTAAGTNGGAMLTSNDCVLVNLHIQRRYRGGKPREYWPFGAQTNLTGPALWSAASITTFTNSYQAFLTALNAITWSGTTMTGPVNVSYYQGFTVVTSPTTGRAKNVSKLRSSPIIDGITSFSINSRVATQRRRQHFSA